MNVRGLQRNVKNVVLNFSDAQVKVREATSNDPWGPSSTLMSEIADLTYNNNAFSEIMQMIWKRLNDHGRNWRHVYKALVLLEYLIKTGSEKVAQQCRENIFAIQTLKDFQYFEENKDQGMNVREKSKFLVTLLKDDEKLKVERARALKAKERFAQSMSYSASGGDLSSNGTARGSHSFHDGLDGAARAAAAALNPDLESARPQTIGEEELQLQLALAMSKEEHEAEEKSRRNEELRLQLAIKQSQAAGKPVNERAKSAIEDLLSLNLGTPAPMFGPGPSGHASATDPWGVPLGTELGATGGAEPASSMVSGAMGGAAGFSALPIAPPPSAMSSNHSHPININGEQASNDPWGSNSTSNSVPTVQDPWQNPTSALPIRSSSANNDPWSPSPAKSTSPSNSNTDPWKPISANGDNQHGNSGAVDIVSSPSAMDSHVNNGQSALADLIGSNESPQNMNQQELQKKLRKTPEAFLGANKNLVNLDALVSAKPPVAISVGLANPFAASTINPFQAAKPPAPSINELRMANQFGSSSTTSSPPTVSGGLAGLESLFTSSNSNTGLLPQRVSPSSMSSAPLQPSPAPAPLFGASSAFSSVSSPANMNNSSNSTSGSGNTFNPFAM